MKLKSFATASILSLSVFLGGMSAQAAGESSKYGNPEKVQNVAHRGASGYAPENTMAAYWKAFKMRADYIEIDVQESQDGQLVVIHDTTLDRTTNGTGKVKDYTMEQLRALDAGSFFDPYFAGEKLPTFEEVIDTFKGKIGILIELKSPELYPGIEEKVAAVLKDRHLDKGRHKKIILQSFNFDSMKTIHALLPNVPIGVLTSNPADLSNEKIAEFSAYSNYINPTRKLVTKELVDTIHESHMGIMSWTVTKQEEVQPLLVTGVDGIITNYPDYIPKHTR